MVLRQISVLQHWFGGGDKFTFTSASSDRSKISSNFTTNDSTSIDVRNGKRVK